MGNQCDELKGILKMSFPLELGIVENWDDMELVWHHTFFKELCVDPKDLTGVLVTEAPMNPKGNREKMVGIMFETFEVQSLYIAI